MSFASVTDLATRLGRTFSLTESPKIEAMLSDATAYLQAEIGQQIEAGESTITLVVDRGETRVELPALPVRSVTEVLLNGEPVEDFELVGNAIIRPCGFGSSTSFAKLTVTYKHGYLAIPGDLVAYTCVLVSGILGQVERNGSLTAGAVTSERIDDYSVQYTQEDSGLSLPERNLATLRAKYGNGSYVVRSR